MTTVDPFEQTENGLDGFVEKLSRMPLEFSPGTAWNYSVSTDVLGYLVGWISGIAFDEFLRQRIFEPLGMVDTGFHVPEEALVQTGRPDRLRWEAGRAEGRR